MRDNSPFSQFVRNQPVSVFGRMLEVGIYGSVGEFAEGLNQAPYIYTNTYLLTLSSVQLGQWISAACSRKDLRVPDSSRAEEFTVRLNRVLYIHTNTFLDRNV